ncbi:hypothetical protein [uncultured Carboxylicivirga sp.]|uniref:hypothetical protein n=1 Tax=uncultured Carboxylicivirga sp. TaxID=1628156 RepID=UPI00259991B2|nr:hypothetical protein [uncultured Carboxylicivirga sp.]
MPKIFNYIQQAYLFAEEYLAKQSGYGLHRRSGYLNIQQSNQKQSQALEIYSSTLLFPMFKRFYRLYPTLNSAL